MRFYYASLFSQILWVVYCVIAVPLAWLIWKGIAGKLTIVGACVSGVLAAALPWTEEWWIAYNFDRLCKKDAGVFISKTVEVDGYYNDTGTISRIVGGPPFKFIESRDRDNRYRRVERATDNEKTSTLSWHAANFKPLQVGRNEWITRRVADHEEIVVEVDTGYAWKVTRLDKPTARYHYKIIDMSTPVAHQITRGQRVVLDSQSGEVIGRYTNYGRGPYWFFISLGSPGIGCRELDGQDPLLERRVLLPTK